MSNAAFLAPVPKTPHDPVSWLLNSRNGWRAAKLAGVEMAPSDQMLALAPLPDSGRRLTEPGGGFGGLTLPSNVAASIDGTLFLLDSQSGQLKCFDPCRCRFEVVSCTGGIGDQPRQLRSPGGIGIQGGNLFVCDTGNRRLQVFSLRGFVLRAMWAPPASASLAQLWQPSDVTFDSRRIVLVSDRANGCVHLFHACGRWLKCLPGFGAVQAITTDREDRLYVCVENADHVQVVDLGTGKPLEQVSRRDLVSDRFAALPFAVDAAGNLMLSGLCESVDGEDSGASGLFDNTGALLPGPAVTARPRYPTQGTYFSQPLDSDLYRCQWDRLVLHANVPEGTRIQVLTHCSETEKPVDLIETLRDDAWSTDQTLNAGQGADPSGGWDCLLRSAPGRFLWLKLVFHGNRTATPRLECIRVEFPRISLRRYLPGVFGAEPVAADFTDRFLAVFDRGFRDIEHQIDGQARLLDPLSAPSGSSQDGKDFLSWLGSWIGVGSERNWPVGLRRRLLKEAGKLFSRRGTLGGLRRYLELYLGLEPHQRRCPSSPDYRPCTTEAPHAWEPPQLILEHFKLRRWLFLGHGRLGDQARLWGEAILDRCRVGGPTALGQTRLGQLRITGAETPKRDAFNIYAHRFSVFVPACFSRTAEQRKGLERLVETEKPAHTTHQIIYVEPRLRIGIQSMIGFDAVIGAYPVGVTLDETPLGLASVLGPAYKGGPSLQIGTEARVGTTTRLT